MNPRDLRTLVEQTAGWPAEDQRELADYARVIEARRSGVYRVSPEERAAITEGLAQADRGEFASDDDITASHDPQ